MQWNVTVWLHKYDLYNKQFPPNKDGILRVVPGHIFFNGGKRTLMEPAGGQKLRVNLAPNISQRIVRNLTSCLELQPGGCRILVYTVLIPVVILTFHGAHIVVVSLIVKTEA